MSTNVIMPQMGESVAEGTVVKWLKKVGDRVERDEALLEISTDKVDAEIPSPAARVLTQILVQENETVEVNKVLAVIDGQGAAATAPAADQPAEPPVASGAAPSQGIASSAAPGQAAARESTQAREWAGRADAGPTDTGERLGAPHKIRSSPLVRRIAQEHHVDLADVHGTGLAGRVSKKDILAYLAAQPSAGTPASATLTGGRTLASVAIPLAAAPAAPAPGPEIVFTGPTHSVAMTPMRKQIAEHMVLSRRTSAHVTTVFEVEM